MSAFMENPFGERISLEEYTQKYLEAIDVFLKEAHNNGVWLYTEQPLSLEAPVDNLGLLAVNIPDIMKSYIPIWSNPADALGLGIYAVETSPQSIPLDIFSRGVLQSSNPDVVAGINPMMRNGKKQEDGAVNIGLIPPVLIPFSILEQIYRGEKSITFYQELAPWIEISKGIKYAI